MSTLSNIESLLSPEGLTASLNGAVYALLNSVRVAVAAQAGKTATSDNTGAEKPQSKKVSQHPPTSEEAQETSVPSKPEQQQQKQQQQKRGVKTIDLSRRIL